MRDMAKRAMVVAVAAALGGAGGGGGTPGEQEVDRMVARTDFRTPARMRPPEILGRRFWNVMHHLPPQSAQVPAMEKHVLNEPMVRDAAQVYHAENLLAKGGDGFTVNGEKLLAIQPARDQGC